MIHEPWRPKVLARLNGREVKLVKFEGALPWHYQEQEDEIFLVWRGGEMRIDLHERAVILQPDELCVVPRRAEDCTRADAKAEVVVFEPTEARETSVTMDEILTAPKMELCCDGAA